MTRTALKPKSIHWLGFSLLQDKLWTNSGLKGTNIAFSHKPYTPKPTKEIVINNRISYSFFPDINLHLFHTDKTQTQFCKPCKTRTLGAQLRLYPQLWLYYTTTSNFFNI